jgi:excisionase family DNA binding protein
MAQVMKIDEVADYLHVHPSTIYRLLKRQEIPAFKIGSDWRFNLESIDQWRLNARDTQNLK